MLGTARAACLDLSPGRVPGARTRPLDRIVGTRLRLATTRRGELTRFTFLLHGNYGEPLFDPELHKPGGAETRDEVGPKVVTTLNATNGD
jgi:hypothetical protein